MTGVSLLCVPLASIAPYLCSALATANILWISTSLAEPTAPPRRELLTHNQWTMYVLWVFCYTSSILGAAYPLLHA